MLTLYFRAQNSEPVRQPIIDTTNLCLSYVIEMTILREIFIREEVLPRLYLAHFKRFHVEAGNPHWDLIIR